MFRKRGRFTKTEDCNIASSDPKKPALIDADHDEDEDASVSQIAKKPKHKLLFKSRKVQKVVPKGDDARVEKQGDDDNENDNSEFKEWYLQDEEHSNGYFSQFDETELIEHHQKPIHKGREVQLAHEDNDGGSGDIAVMVHRLNPPFLNASSILSTNAQIVDVIKDKSGDLYQHSRNGSALLSEKRKLNDRKQKSKQDILQKSTMDKIIQEEEENEEDDDDKRDEQESEDLISNLNKSKPEQVINRENLPAYKVRGQLVKLINENQVTIVIGETGSGKTTQLPQILYEEGYHHNGMIGITQPRRMAAISVAKRVSEEMNVKIGENVGFTVRFNDFTSDLTEVKFMTDGVLLRETLNDSDLNKYSCVIMDEAHERSLNTDILFGIFKKLLTKRRDFKLIITSATMNSAKFSRFFNNAVQFKIPGKTYPVDIMFQSIPSADYIDSAVKQALKIHLSNPFQAGDNGDILIFMTGQEDIEVTCQLIEEELHELMKLNDEIAELDILPVYSSLSAHLQSKIFRDSKNRKCMVATNIAETSLTLKNVKFVIDSGLMKLKVYNPKLNMDSLQIVPISKAQASQRSGRAGRTCPGQSFRLYTLSSFEDEMWDEPIPEIQRSNLMNTILLLKNLNISDINKFKFIDKPSMESIETSQYELWSIGALDNFGSLTSLGRSMSQFPIDPLLSKMLIISNFKKFNCTAEIVRIVAMLSVPNIFIRSRNDANLQKKSDKIRENFQIGESDHLTLLNIFNQFYNIKSTSKNIEEAWCNKNYFNYKSLKSATDIHDQILQLVTKNLKRGEKITSCYDDWEIIKECICASFYSNAAEFYKHGQYKHCRSGLEMYLHPTSSLNGIGDLPKYVVFHELLLTGQKQHMNYVTAIRGEWLIAYGSVFYSRRVRGVSSKENQRLKEEQFQKLIDFERLKSAEHTERLID